MMYGERIMSVITLSRTSQIVEVMFLKCFLITLLSLVLFMWHILQVAVDIFSVM